MFQKKRIADHEALKAIINYDNTPGVFIPFKN